MSANAVKPTQEQRIDADARLRDAAPDLLAALQSIVPRFHSCIVFSGTDPEFADLAVEHARAAIAKATGEQP